MSCRNLPLDALQLVRLYAERSSPKVESRVIEGDLHVRPAIVSVLGVRAHS